VVKTDLHVYTVSTSSNQDDFVDNQFKVLVDLLGLLSVLFNIFSVRTK